MMQRSRLSYAEFWPEGRAPTYLYHGTSTVHLSAIKKDGLRPQTPSPRWGSRPWTGRVLFITTKQNEAARWAKDAAEFYGGRPVVIRIRTADPSWRGLFVRDYNLPSTDAWKTAEPIPTSALDVCERKRCRALRRR
jgi:hypothetical protein